MNASSIVVSRRADACQEIVLQEEPGPPQPFQLDAEHPQREHVEQDVEEARRAGTGRWPAARRRTSSPRPRAAARGIAVDAGKSHGSDEHRDVGPDERLDGRAHRPRSEGVRNPRRRRISPHDPRPARNERIYIESITTPVTVRRSNFRASDGSDSSTACRVSLAEPRRGQAHRLVELGEPQRRAQRGQDDEAAPIDRPTRTNRPSGRGPGAAGSSHRSTGPRGSAHDERRRERPSRRPSPIRRPSRPPRRRRSSQRSGARVDDAPTPRCRARGRGSRGRAPASGSARC